MVPIHDDAGPADGPDLIDGELDYIMKIPAHYENDDITYFLPVGRSNGFRSPDFKAAKNNSHGAVV